ncbi:hypothetical protein RHSIM_Rhsim13G0126900 [Rhododendron simsii]|uniref:Uncharacterized protein n=1 Tax=Rhododendron simsii TaxID=118357 RepID=A0A834G0P2_RHOSS|nr:hypothetical protein RHSIM_Rhsim13G0126900 [Rhododendron simsii]
MQSASEGPKGAQAILYVLDALKDCLLLLSLKFLTGILTYFKSLLELRQLVVSRRITNSLNAICLLPNSEVSLEVLLDLLCTLGLSISVNEMSAYDMTFTAKLLDVGMSKIYAFNRKNCIVELPLVFTALGGVYSSYLLKGTINNLADIQKLPDEDFPTESRNLQEQPAIRGIICSNLQIPIHQNKSSVEGKGDPFAIETSIPRQQAMARYTPQVAADNLEVLKKSARELLSLLSKIFMETSKDVGGCLLVLLPSHLNKKTLCVGRAAFPSHAITCM